MHTKRKISGTQKPFVSSLVIWSCVLLIILFFILIFMDGKVWGDLPKSQIDNQLIEEAIASAIEAHNNDPEAHMAEGQSIYIHRTNDIIDHPALSIVPDKFSGGDLVFNTSFQTIDGWALTGDVSLDDLNGVKLAVEYGVTNTSKMTGSKYVGGMFFDQSSDMYFETQTWFDFSNLHINSWLGFLTGYQNTNTGFGFQVRDGTLYSIVRRGGSTEEENLGTLDVNNPHFYSAFYDESEQLVYFYYDKVLVSTLEVPTGTNWEDDRVPTFGVTLTQSNDGILHAVYINSWRKLLTD